MEVMETYVFFAGNAVVLPLWVLMIAAPRWSFTQKAVRSLVAPLLVALLYLLLLLTHQHPTGGGFFTPSDVVLLFQSRHVVIAGWMHYLAFDLFVGSWMFRDAEEQKLPHLALVPCLLLTLLLGPLGLLSYLLLRVLLRRSGLRQGFLRSL